jgi:hypothetical protein
MFNIFFRDRIILQENCPGRMLPGEVISTTIRVLFCHENGHDAKRPQAHRMKIEYPGACCNNVGRQGCPNFGTWIPS